MTGIATGEYDATFVFRGDVERLVALLRVNGYNVDQSSSLREIGHTIFTVDAVEPTVIDFEMTPSSLQLVANDVNESTERSQV